MRFDRGRVRRDDEERILPLVNVVFLLLVFFMVVGRLASSDPLRIEPPRSTSDRVPSSREIVVRFGDDGRTAVDGDLVEETALADTVARRLASPTGHPSPPRVRLAADKRAEATRVVAVMERLREAGVGRIELLTVPRSR